MVEILLACGAGMSTSMLVQRMESAAKEKDIDAKIWAVALTEVEENIEKNNVDILLIGPQVKYNVPKFKEKFEPEIVVTDINMMDYGRMNGEKVLEDALKLLGE